MTSDPILAMCFKVADKRGCRVADVLDMSETEFLGWCAFYFSQPAQAED